MTDRNIGRRALELNHVPLKAADRRPAQCAQAPDPGVHRCKSLRSIITILGRGLPCTIIRRMVLAARIMRGASEVAGVFINSSLETFGT
jgi:hypothetical protein